MEELAVTPFVIAAPPSTLQSQYLTCLVVPLQHNQHLVDLFGLVSQTIL